MSAVSLLDLGSKAGDIDKWAVFPLTHTVPLAQFQLNDGLGPREGVIGSPRLQAQIPPSTLVARILLSESTFQSSYPRIVSMKSVLFLLIKILKSAFQNTGTVVGPSLAFELLLVLLYFPAAFSPWRHLW